MSLKQVAGGPSPAAIQGTAAADRSANGVSGKYVQTLDPDQSSSNEFPYVPFAPDDYDTIASIKSEVGADASKAAYGEKWMVPFTEQDAQYLIRQRNQSENADFDRWVMKKFDLKDPAQLFLFQQIAPEQFQRRMDLIDYQQNLVSKYAKMRLRGPKSIEDLQFEWLVETGRIELPEGPIWDPAKWMKAQGVTDEARWASRFQAGLFSPLKYLTENQVGWKASANRADIRGDENTRFNDQGYVGSKDPNVGYKSYGKNPYGGRGKYSDITTSAMIGHN